MDEILIDEKRYVSSKRAAQLTGYAKDYVGQLCREGRVPARLVGRSWYVLESAIQDHRFGASNEDPATSPRPESEQTEDAFPRYEALEPQILPSVNRLDESASIYGNENTNAPSAVQGQPEESEAENSWKNWFDAAVIEPIQASKRQEENLTLEPGPVEESVQEDTEEVEVPIRAIYHPELRVKRDIQEEQTYVSTVGRAQKAEERYEAPQERRDERAWAYTRPLQFVMAFIAIFAVSVAILGSGYVDKYLANLGEASVLAGITAVNK